MAAEWAGFQTIGQCEYADYPTKVLEKHWPDVPRWRDIRTLTKESFIGRTGLSTVDVISGGFPCQPFSVAGKRRGAEDDRYLWPEMLRVVSELKPAWVVGENVAGIVNMALNQVLADLEGQGYEVQAFLIPACGVDAPHKRERVAVLAHTRSSGCSWPRGIQRHDKDSSAMGQWASSTVVSASQDVADAENRREQGKLAGRCEARRPCGGCRWTVEPDVGRVAHGVPSRVDRLKGLGNAVVPPAWYPIFKAIADIEGGHHEH